MTVLRLNVLGPLEILGRIGTPPPAKALANRRARITLALLGIYASVQSDDLKDWLWGEGKLVSRDSLDQVLLAARRQLGKHGANLRTETPMITLHRELQSNGSVLEISTDADEFYAVRRGSSEQSLRDALALVRGPIGHGLAIPAEADDRWLDAARSRQRLKIKDLIEQLMPTADATDDLVDMALSDGGAKVLDSIDALPPPHVPTAPFEGVSWELLGVTPAAIGPNRLPDHLPRPSIDRRLDDALANALEGGGRPSGSARFVIIHGPAKYGKTRAMYEAVRRMPALRRTQTAVLPDARSAVGALATAQVHQGGLILWIDDIDAYVAFDDDADGLTAARLARALQLNPNLVILATSGGKGPFRLDPDRRGDRLGLPWQEILASATLVEIRGGGPDPRDVEAARAAGWSIEVIAAIERYGLGAALSAGPDLLHALSDGERGHPAGWALVMAMVVLRQHGWERGPVPLAVLRPAWHALLPSTMYGSVEQDRWDSAVEFATTPVRGEAQLAALTSPETLDLNDYVASRVRLDGARRRKALLAALDEATSPSADFAVGVVRTSIALELLHGLDPHVILNLFGQARRVLGPPDAMTHPLANGPLACWASIDDPWAFFVLARVPEVMGKVCDHLEHLNFQDVDLLRTFARAATAPALGPDEMRLRSTSDEYSRRGAIAWEAVQALADQREPPHQRTALDILGYDRPDERAADLRLVDAERRRARAAQLEPRVLSEPPDPSVVWDYLWELSRLVLTEREADVVLRLARQGDVHAARRLFCGSSGKLREEARAMLIGSKAWAEPNALMYAAAAIGTDDDLAADLLDSVRGIWEDREGVSPQVIFAAAASKVAARQHEVIPALLDAIAYGDATAIELARVLPLRTSDMTLLEKAWLDSVAPFEARFRAWTDGLRWPRRPDSDDASSHVLRATLSPAYLEHVGIAAPFRDIPPFPDGSRGILVLPF
jgi:hypothetical protein